MASGFSFYASTLVLNDVFGILACSSSTTLAKLAYSFGSAPTGTAAIIQLIAPDTTIIATFTLAAGAGAAIQAPDGGPAAISANIAYRWKITQIGGTLAGTFLGVAILTA